MLKLVDQKFPVQSGNGIYAFLTAQTAANMSRKKLDCLADHYINRVYIGVESGCEAVLEVLRKPQTPSDVVEGVRQVKAAGIDVGVIVLAGVGGHELSNPHIERTIELVGSLPLDSNDIVYVSPLEEDDTANYREQLNKHSLSRMGFGKIAAQAQLLRSRLSKRVPARVTRYHVSEFVYV
jgi:molybdenum cofactor biosynthesis enzyme MoaA